ncbi:tRNA wybutosine-synthesizing protein 3 homolog isoform X1 [Lytechinus variegatus]|uniref:tRNA wybutosine-synthesizing protein 3 homolog isoform X1 n=1 Tax=Lytechinus variegatus TaxID=7654 RepID=UPI001BB2CE1A|nr:tRNA wybutosine-synthesizing protein 3 homolog isoform X1 [Lytechinus variegatus]
MAFSRAKKSRLKGTDFSRKGEIDQFIVSLVDKINKCDNYFTTSSCSGRIILFSESFDESAVKKKGCKWLFVSHESASSSDLISALKVSKGDAIFKFEPFVLHVQCETIEHARKLHQAAVASGFRNSGITIGNGGKTIAAIRSTHGLEVPLTAEGRLLVSDEYINFIVNIANSKMKENFNRIERFQDTLEAMLSEEDEDDPPSRIKLGRSRYKVKHKLTQTSDSQMDLETNHVGEYKRLNDSEFKGNGSNSGDNDCDVMSDLQDFASIFDHSDENR